jgi:predicted metalloprotease with PDZ domain
MDDVFILYDRASGTVWYPREEVLEGVGGRLKGETLPFVAEPSPVALGEWLDAHPDSAILLPTEMDFRELSRPYLGVRLEEDEDVVVILSVVEDSPAAEAGFRNGDVLRRFGGRDLERRSDLREIMIEFSAGDTVDVIVEREGEMTTLRPTLGSS